MVHMFHMIVKPHDSGFPYVRVCKELFGDNRCLVMKESKGGEHCHIQGEMDELPSKYHWERKLCPAYSKMHPKTKEEPGCHPVKRRKREADEQGFMYMAKELPDSVVLYKQGITDEYLEELYEKSNEYREELQSKPGEYILEKIGPNTTGWTPSELHKRVCYYAFQYYLGEGKMRPPNIKILCEHWMAKYWGDRLDVAEYISSRWM